AVIGDRRARHPRRGSPNLLSLPLTRDFLATADPRTHVPFPPRGLTWALTALMPYGRTIGQCPPARSRLGARTEADGSARGRLRWSSAVRMLAIGHRACDLV